MTTITVEAHTRAPLDSVWAAWNSPDAIRQWNTASPDWHTTQAQVDLRVGGHFRSRMEAKDGSMGFDFSGTYTAIDPGRRLQYRLDDGRSVQVEFIPQDDGVLIRETFDAEPTHSVDQQRQGWQAILDSFARHVAGKAD